MWLMRLFRRRPQIRGRHEAGSAPVVPLPPVPVCLPAPSTGATSWAGTAITVPAAPAVQQTPVVQAPVDLAAGLAAGPPRAAGPVPTAPTLPGPRVELGFRDGSRTQLEPGSGPARALEDLARSLTRGR